jgi:uncharacterized protein (TIGR02145 family)
LLLLFNAVLFAQQKDSFTDSRDGEKYKTVKIGAQVWMAENLRYEVRFSSCPDKTEYYKKYGCLYDMRTFTNDDVEPIKAICPPGWHLPSNEEWDVLIGLAGGKKKAGKKLRAKTGWNNRVSRRGDFISKGNGTDDYGFMALPGGGCGIECGIACAKIGDAGYWWSATNDKYDIYYKVIESGIDSVASGTVNDCIGFSVRCVQD